MKHVKIVFIIMLLGLFSCAGSPGKDGTNGVDVTTDSTAGFNSLITITDESPGENCETGGKRIDTGLDDGDGDGIANDGILQESEIDFSEYVCNGLDGADGSDGTNGTNGDNGSNGADSTADTVIAYNLSGKLQKGPCPEGGEVLIQPISYTDMYQTGGHFIGFTIDNFGRYYIPAELENEDPNEKWAEVFFKGFCHDELTGGYNYQEFTGIIDMSDPVNNINPLTDIRSYVGRWLFGDPLIISMYGLPDSGTEGDISASLLLAEIRILSFLQMPAAGKRFTQMNLENADIGDAILAWFNSMVLFNSADDPGDYLTRLAVAVIEDNQIFKAEIQETSGLLPIITIKKNLEARYLELGEDISAPPIWNLGYPEYYADLLERVPVEQGSFNLDDSAGCSFDMSTYNMFAIPHVFESWIETSKYLALNLAGGDISVWTRIFNGYDRPGAKIIEIEELREILLEGNLTYNGLLGDHSLSAGTDYYIVISNDTGWALSTGCDGGLLPFGRKLASQDGGLNWIGHDNITTWFRKSGLKISGWN